MNKPYKVWLALLSVLVGCNQPIDEHVTSDNMAMVGFGSPTDQPEYAKAMLDEDYVLAEEIARGLVNANPNDASCLIALAHPQMLQGDLSAATANYEKAIELDPRNTIALYSRGLVAQEQEDFEDAKMFYERTLEVDNNSSEGHYGMAAACEGLGLNKLVIKHASKFLELRPDSAMADEANDMIRIAKHETNKNVEPFATEQTDEPEPE